MTPSLKEHQICSEYIHMNTTNTKGNLAADRQTQHMKNYSQRLQQSVRTTTQEINYILMTKSGMGMSRTTTKTGQENRLSSESCN